MRTQVLAHNCKQARTRVRVFGKQLRPTLASQRGRVLARDVLQRVPRRFSDQGARRAGAHPLGSVLRGVAPRPGRAPRGAGSRRGAPSGPSHKNRYGSEMGRDGSWMFCSGGLRHATTAFGIGTQTTLYNCWATTQRMKRRRHMSSDGRERRLCKSTTVCGG